VLGIYISYFVDVSSGASVVLLSAAVFVAVLAWSKIRSNWMPGSAGDLSRLPRESTGTFE